MYPQHDTAFAALPGHTHLAEAAATPAAAPRRDLYVLIHKALRPFMAHTLQRLGAMDVDDTAERNAALDGVLALLQFLRGHLQHENDFVHTAIEARRPGAARHTADDHLLHLDALDNLEDEVRAVRHAGDSQRAGAALRLYRHLAVFVGENLVHMQLEETQNNALLWQLYSDDELQTIEQRLMATIAPAEMALTMRWMAQGLSAAELAALLGGVRQAAPPPVFDALVYAAAAALDEQRRLRLARALGLAAVPGLVDA